MWRPFKDPLTAAVFITMLLSVVVNVATETLPDSWQPWSWLSWPTACLLAVMVVVLQRRPSRDDAATPEEETAQLEAATRVLATAVCRQWTEELKLRGLREAAPLQVQWSTVNGLFTAEPAVVLKDRTLRGRTTRLRGHGDIQAAISDFRRLPYKQLAVLGASGAGKSVLAMLLTVELLERPAAGDPVPVLMSLASWRPGTEHLYAWLARQLNDQYSFLTEAEVYGRDIARRMILSGRIMPVLDGLDEMAAPLRSMAIEKLDHIVGDRPLVVTSRWVEYLSAVHAGGHLLSKAAVIGLEPLQVADVAAYLGTTSAAGVRWAPVLGAIRDHPDLPLTHALSSPLLISLARTVYASEETNPGELLDAERFPDRDAIERHLLEAFIPASYTDRPLPPGTISAVPVPGRYDKDFAHRSLVHLARHMHRLGTDSLAWWQLNRALPRHALGIFAGLVSGVLAGLPVGLVAGAVFAPQYRPVAGIATGLGVGLGAGLIAGYRRGVTPSRILLDFRGRGRQIRQSLATGLAVGPVAGVVFGLIFWSVAGVADGLEIGLVAGLVAGVVGGLGVGVMAAARAPIDSTRIVSPRTLLQADRSAALLQAAMGGLAAAIGTGCIAGLMARPEARSAVTTVAALGVGIGVALVAVCNTAWGHWVLARAWLALGNRTPWSTMDFLEDAHRRGVLRQAGGVYQFRHSRLQERLTLNEKQHGHNEYN